MLRRSIISLAGLVAQGIAPSILAQDRPPIPRIGLLVAGSPRPSVPAPVEALLAGLRELGYIDGRTIKIEYRWAEGKPQMLPELAVDLVRVGVDLIIATGDASIRAARAATSSLPIVMATSGDAVGAGFVSSLARPGGNVTGMTAINPDLGPKRLQLLRELLPKATRFAVVWNPADSAHALDLNATELAAIKLGVMVRPMPVRVVADVEKVFAELGQQRVDAAIVFNDSTTSAARARIVELAAEARIPVMYEAAEWVDAGGLVSYGVTHAELFRRSALYVDRILRGARPADLPIEQPTRLQLSVNRKTAGILGINIPSTTLHRADRVIE